jgi:hypothetical protein
MFSTRATTLTHQPDPRDLENNNFRPTLYVKKSAGFSSNEDDCDCTPHLYQPTPAGIDLLCQHYSQKYAIDLLSVDLREHVAAGDNVRHFFNYLQTEPTLTDVQEGQARGLVLNHGAYHAVPVLVCMINGQKHMVVFDSTSGCRTQGYYGIARLFSDTLFYVNAGTRQADEGSCITDAICILKEALQIPRLIDILQEKQISEYRCLTPTPSDISYIPRFQVTPPDNFRLFRMPEPLLVTAQSSTFVNQAAPNFDAVLRTGKTLQYYRQNYRMTVSLASDEPGRVTSINSYLYLKAKEHKKILDAFFKPLRLSRTQELRQDNSARVVSR